ncbi:hypothetical protein [Bacillus piscicola]|uniref:hypothetical protein n=1 Tax=Bacillus piscicola TaxID=1632684 RepID=UPI001F0934AD|nr:hypothetical protein [Bacillus piscicola]
MKQAVYGLLLYLFLLLPPVADLLESIMIVHMHMQMPLLVAAGFLMGRFLQNKFPLFFEKWNHNGVPGIVLFVIIWSYWMIPRAMDEALTFQTVEWFKFFSLPFLAGVSLRDSWKKLTNAGKNSVLIYAAAMLLFMAFLYIGADEQICNNYLEIEQQTLGWGSLAIGVCIVIYLLQLLFIDQSEFR